MHVQDPSNVCLRLVEEAVKGGGNATWGRRSITLRRTGALFAEMWLRSLRRMCTRRGSFPPEIENVTPEEADKLVSHGSYLWGMNPRARAIVAKKLFGWNPTQKFMFDLLLDIVGREGRSLGLTSGHAVQAAG